MFLGFQRKEDMVHVLESLFISYYHYSQDH